ncbi:hypothetical protein H2201_007282 [Coniosporium apollinis]|uniref:Adenosinetriphosphatase n=1 Tax=Coniosporium apollinis TaxID=61459 RepID=A0ABQ9NN54_9PEZI|nr:hypothetical protein H2201_007282 [Coniosporium apollinis]
MAPNNKKKKKPAANPARGFATTSVASKPKPNKKEDAADVSETGSTPTAPTSVASEDLAGRVPGSSEKPKELHELSPEELEQQLEQNELQVMVDKHGAKTRKESSRQVQRAQTDRRVLRGQAQHLSTKDWLPEELMLQILDLVQGELNDSSQFQTEQGSAMKSLPEEDLVVKLWTLHQALSGLGFSEDRIKQVLNRLCTYPPNEDPQIWGFQESLQWLAVNCEMQELEDYDAQKPKSLGNQDSDISRPNTVPGTPDRIATSGTQTPRTSEPLTSGLITPALTSATSPAESPKADDPEVTDLESDLEPDELLSKYLSIKSRLYAARPDLLADDASSKRRQKPKGPNMLPPSAPLTPAIKTLQGQLRRIESDILFDEREAEEQWNARRNQIAQDKAARVKMQLPDVFQDKDPKLAIQQDTETATNMILKNAAALGDSLMQQDQDSEDAALFGGMFSAVPGETDSTEEVLDQGGGALDGVRIRDFGESTGMSPRRILEEACRSRDSAARLSFKLVSPTTYASRHSLSISWSKAQEVLSASAVPDVWCDWRERAITMTMTTIATPGEHQSECYISTAALFLIFSGSPKEEKAYLRLPPVWRDLWAEFEENKKEHSNAADRDMLKELRNLAHNQRESEEEEDVALMDGFKKRNQIANGSSNSTEQLNGSDGVGHAYSGELQEMWKRRISTPSYQRMLLSRFNLPIFRFREAALSAIEHNQITILCGETGCGKSTQLPAFILEHELSQGKPCKIYCTEPRRISAISLAQRVSEELGEHRNDLGTPRSLVGYAIRLESHVASSTRLVYATVGVVLRMLESAAGLDDITHLVIDEVHERSIDTDFLLIILRSLLLRRPELRVILMSATVDAQRFSTYLNNAPILTVPGRTFPVQTKYLEDAIELTHYTADRRNKHNNGSVSDEDDDEVPENNKSGIPAKLQGYSATTRETLAQYDEYRIDYELIIRLIERVASDTNYRQFSKAVLVFLPGMAEIRQLNDMLLGHPAFSQGWYIYPLHSTIASEEQQAAFLVPPNGIRKIVLATNIAETGITIPDITCVIDTGKHKEMRYDERRQLSRLTQSFISRANAKQRRGRAGRVQEGLCFHLFTKYRHDELMAEQQTPEMLRLSLQDLVMRVKICRLGDIERTLSEALDPPSSKNIRRAIDALIEVDALTPGEELTPLGRQLAKMPLDANLGKLTLLASTFGCVDMAITVAAILSSKSPFITPFGARQRADTVRLAFKRADSDLLTAYNAYLAWKNVCITQGVSEMQFCRKNFLSPQNLSNIEDLKSQLLSSLADAGAVVLGPDERAAMSRYRYASRHRTFVPVPPSCDRNNDNDLLTTSVIAWAFYPKLLTRDGKGWRNVANNQSVSLHPTSVNKGTATAKYLSYYHIMQSSNKFYNAHSTTIAHPLPVILLAGDAAFNLYAGVITLDGNRLRFSVRDWKTMIALKMLRARTKEIVSVAFKSPGKPLSRRLERWMEILRKVFERDEKGGRSEAYLRAA